MSLKCPVFFSSVRPCALISVVLGLWRNPLKAKASEWVTALGSSPSFISRDRITTRGSALTPGVSVEQSRDLPVKWQLITSTPAAVRISPSCLPSTVFKVRTWTFYSSVCAAGCSGGSRVDCWVITKGTTSITHGLGTTLYASIT